jgi:hypothetical protein
MAVAYETYFEGYTVQYQWKVHDISTRWYNPQALTSPLLNSKPGQKPATEWKLSLRPTQLGQTRVTKAQDSEDSQKRTPSQITMCAGVVLERLDGKRVGFDWPVLVLYAEVHMKAYRNELYAANMIGSVHQNPTKLCSRSNPVKFNDFFSLNSQCSECVIIDCEIKVWQLENPKHNKAPLSPKVTLPEFNLCKVMDEACRSNLFTDVTLVVADGKEFKAHKAILAAQSPFFKTRFEGRWSDGRDPENITTRVEMPDVTEVVMDTILSYLYTGKATDIKKIAFQVLPTAEEYGIEGLQKMCEEALAETLTDENVFDILVHAETYNAPDMRKACMKYIISNTQTVHNSEGWSKLKSKETEIYRKLWMELVEAIAEIH